MATSRRKPPNPGRVVKPIPIDWETGDDEPLRLNSADIPEVETKPLFYLDETEYRVPITFPASLALRYLKELRQRGEDTAAAVMLEECLGTDAYDALMNYRGLTAEHLSRIIRIVGQLLLGSLEDPKESSLNGSSRSGG